MVDLANPYSMHQAMSARQPLTGPGPFSYVSNNSHMFNDGRSAYAPRTNTNARSATATSLGHSRSESSDNTNAGTYKYQSQSQPEARDNVQFPHVAGGRSQVTSHFNSNIFEMDISRLVEKDAEQKAEQSRSQPSSPSSRRPSQAPSDQSNHRRQSSSHSIVPYLQIPATINDSKGSLAEFAAQVRTAAPALSLLTARCLTA